MESSTQAFSQVREYSAQDLHSTEVDPRCLDASFPLASLWPVYLSCFYVPGSYRDNHVGHVQEYFASKGLLATHVFGRSKEEDSYREHQAKTGYYDFLVYFLRRQDALDAIDRCHRDAYYGAPLNVYCGRDPVLFDIWKSANFTIANGFPKAVERSFENYFEENFHVRVACACRHSPGNLLVEFQSQDDFYTVVENCSLFPASVVAPKQSKQRFLEHDVLEEIVERIQLDPGFLNMRPSDYIMDHLLRGQIPVINRNWRLNTVPVLDFSWMSPKLKKAITQQCRRSASFGFEIECKFGKEESPNNKNDNRRKSDDHPEEVIQLNEEECVTEISNMDFNGNEQQKNDSMEMVTPCRKMKEIQLGENFRFMRKLSMREF
ncbi:uncharacterized protein LOC129755384 [Uranotaenia lowii]|uniref:uncharacterized protein LOC129755384 n=1 Tax=Uranotaenia lowii TaxID=190385 RepID=UPI00247AC2E9|nr:uncharacterized protein LOC129755384 [Uranotaenia lowii]